MKQQHRTRWKRSMTTLAVVVATALAIGLGCANQLIMPPVATVRWDGAERRFFQFEGKQVSYFVSRSIDAEPAAFVLRLTGDAAGATKFTASRWKPHPVEVWVVSYPGYGDSEGPRTLKQLARVALASFDEIKKAAGPRPIFIEGVSLATTPALCVAARRPVAGVILQNPPPLKQVIVGQHGWWNLWIIASAVACQIPRELDSIENAKLVQAPAVFLLAEKDSVVLPKYQKRVVDAYACAKRTIVQRGADHNQPLTPDEEAELSHGIDWLVASDTETPPLQAKPGGD